MLGTKIVSDFVKNDPHIPKRDILRISTHAGTDSKPTIAPANDPDIRLSSVEIVSQHGMMQVDSESFGVMPSFVGSIGFRHDVQGFRGGCGGVVDVVVVDVRYVQMRINLSFKDATRRSDDNIDVFHGRFQRRRSAQRAVQGHEFIVDFNVQIDLIGVQLREGVGGVQFSSFEVYIFVMDVVFVSLICFGSGSGSISSERFNEMVDFGQNSSFPSQSCRVRMPMRMQWMMIVVMIIMIVIMIVIFHCFADAPVPLPVIQQHLVRHQGHSPPVGKIVDISVVRPTLPILRHDLLQILHRRHRLERHFLRPSSVIGHLRRRHPPPLSSNGHHPLPGGLRDSPQLVGFRIGGQNGEISRVGMGHQEGHCAFGVFIFHGVTSLSATVVAMGGIGGLGGDGGDGLHDVDFEQFLGGGRRALDCFLWMLLSIVAVAIVPAINLVGPSDVGDIAVEHALAPIVTFRDRFRFLAGPTAANAFSRQSERGTRTSRAAAAAVVVVVGKEGAGAVRPLASLAFAGLRRNPLRDVVSRRKPRKLPPPRGVLCGRRGAPAVVLVILVVAAKGGRREKR